MHYNTTIDPVNTGIITVYQGATVISFYQRHRNKEDERRDRSE